jgi:hypothetical protein
MGKIINNQLEAKWRLPEAVQLLVDENLKRCILYSNKNILKKV